LFADVILNPVFPDSDFKRQQKQTLAGIEREQTVPQLMALRVLPSLLYGAGHAYGNPLTGSGSTDSVGKMTREDLAKFHQTWYHPNNATLVMAGDTTLAEIKPKLEKLFANWKSGQVPKKNIASVSLPQKSAVYLIDKPGAIQSIIITGSVAPPKSNPQEIPMEAMNDALGGTFSSRLNLNLREDKHWSYGARTLLFGARAQRPFISISPVQTDKTKDSLVEINKEFRGILGDHPVTADELARIQDNETLRLPGSRETTGEVGQSILDLVQYGLPDDYYETYAGKVRALKVADVEAAAKAIVHPDNLIWVIVGDRSKIEAGVKELNLGELRFLSPDGKTL
jgi:zinc protease